MEYCSNTHNFLNIEIGFMAEFFLVIQNYWQFKKEPKKAFRVVRYRGIGTLKDESFLVKF